MPIDLAKDMGRLRQLARQLAARRFADLALERNGSPMFDRMRDRKLVEARAVLDGAAAGPLLAAEAEARGVDPRQLAGLVVEKAVEAGRREARLEVARVATNAAIDGAPLPRDLDRVLQRIGLEVSIERFEREGDAAFSLLHPMQRGPQAGDAA